MARKFPQFLFSNPNNTKSEGPYIIHTLFPKAILKIQPNGIIVPLDVWDECNEIDLHKMVNKATTWYFYSRGHREQN